MAATLRKHNTFLKLFIETQSQQQRKVLIQTATNSQMRILSEIAFNILSGNVKLTEMNKRKLQRYKTLIRLLASRKSVCWKKKASLKSIKGIVYMLSTITFMLK